MPHGSFAKKKSHPLAQISEYVVLGCWFCLGESRSLCGRQTWRDCNLTLLPAHPPFFCSVFAIADVVSQIPLPVSVSACCHAPCHGGFFILKSEAQINSSLLKLLLVTVFLTQQQ